MGQKTPHASSEPNSVYLLSLHPPSINDLHSMHVQWFLHTNPARAGLPSNSARRIVAWPEHTSLSWHLEWYLSSFSFIAHLFSGYGLPFSIGTSMYFYIAPISFSIESKCLPHSSPSCTPSRTSELLNCTLSPPSSYATAINAALLHKDQQHGAKLTRDVPDKIVMPFLCVISFCHGGSRTLASTPPCPTDAVCKCCYQFFAAYYSQKTNHFSTSQYTLCATISS